MEKPFHKTFNYGDVDVDKDILKLTAIVCELGKKLYILSEMAGRFGNEARRDFDEVAEVVIGLCSKCGVVHRLNGECVI